jgi:hypothetical protein
VLQSCLFAAATLHGRLVSRLASFTAFEPLLKRALLIACPTARLEAQTAPSACLPRAPPQAGGALLPTLGDAVEVCAADADVLQRCAPADRPRGCLAVGRLQPLMLGRFSAGHAQASAAGTSASSPKPCRVQRACQQRCSGHSCVACTCMALQPSGTAHMADAGCLHSVLQPFL